MTKTKTYLTIFILIIIAFIVTIFALSLKQSVTNDSHIDLEEYPDSLLEGEIISINSEDLSLLVNVKVSKIISGNEDLEKFIKITSNTKIVFYDLESETENIIEFKDLEIGDWVLVATEKPTRERILMADEEFTAMKITKASVGI